MSLFTPDTSDIDNHFDRGHFLLAWRISMSFSIVFILLGVIYSIANPIGVFPVIGVLIVAFYAARKLKRTRKVRLVFWIFAIGGTLIANLALNFVMDFTHYVDFLWLITCIVIAFIGLGKKEGLLFIVINAIGIAIFFWFSLNRHIESLKPRTTIQITGDFIEVLFAFFVIAYILTQFVHLQKLAEEALKTANGDLAKQNRLILSKSNDNETLIKEIHHRVKNNLQIIVSLLRMQSLEMKTEEGKSHFSASINRIMAMSLIHEKLYAEKEFSEIDLKSYLEELTHEIINATSINDNAIAVHIETDVQRMNLNTIIPLGLLINELVSNSLKHALPEVEQGEVRIDISMSNGKYQLIYSDNGMWKSNQDENMTFGTELIEILTLQMNGKKSLSTENGTQYLFILDEV